MTKLHAFFLTSLGGVCSWLLIALPLAPTMLSAAPQVVAGFTHVRSLGDIDEYRMEENDLQVLLKADHSVPVVTFQVTYHVGSRNEAAGTTGATHILEHMMFKGSEHYNATAGNDIDVYLGRVGSSYNATTSFDRTNYFATVGRDALEGYIAIESDRMRNLWLRESDRQQEMTVVRNEYERGENSPDSALYKEIFATAYEAQPYHHTTIGWRSDIEKVPITKLREFYDTFYWPNNATVTLVGDFDTTAALELVKKYYGGISRSPHPIPQVYTEEPPQQGPRRLILKRTGQLGTVMIAYKGPNASDPDLPALTVLGDVLSTGTNSRLSRALIDTSLATRVEAEIQPMHDPGLFMVSANLMPGARPQDVEDVILHELAAVKAQRVTAEEVTRAESRYRAEEAYQRDGPAAMAANLNEWIAVGDWTLYVTFSDKVAHVTPAAVQGVAKKYLNEDQSTTGWFVPTVSNESETP
jgi:zinc protease